MVPAGYLFKHVTKPPGWLAAPHVRDICSVANCVNTDAVDVQRVWRHNAFGLSNDEHTLLTLAAEQPCDLSGARLFYYEAYEEELETDGWDFDPSAWRPLTAAPSAVVKTQVAPPTLPTRAALIGYDVVVFGDYLEHSPLSCNSVAEKLPVNNHCLLESLEAALAAVNQGQFGDGCEEGVYKIFSVSLVLTP